jgi:hypothetical protein
VSLFPHISAFCAIAVLLVAQPAKTAAPAMIALMYLLFMPQGSSTRTLFNRVITPRLEHSFPLDAAEQQMQVISGTNGH